MTENNLSKILVDIAYQIHKKLGPGLLESVYEDIYVYELKNVVLNLDNKLKCE